MTDDWAYVFGNARPRNRKNKGAGLDVSPSTRDYLGIRSGARCDWRFVDVSEVPPGPWRKYGVNNPFVKNAAVEEKKLKARMELLRKRRDEWLKKQYRVGQ